MSLSAALALGSTVWDDVVARSGSPPPFMGWSWHKAWADSAPANELESSEVLVLHAADGSVQALLPIRLCRVRFRRAWVRAVTWTIGDVCCPDELDLPALPEADLASLAEALSELPWQVVMLSNLTEAAPHVERLRAALEQRGHRARSEPLYRCPQLTLPASWDAYLATLSANRRQILRRQHRQLQKDHTVAVTDYGEHRLDEGWRHLMKLHDQRWEETGGGAFRDPRSEKLQRRFAREMAQRKRLWLTTLDVDGHPVAAWYGFVSEHTVYFYQCGRDPRWKRKSVGSVLMGLMIRRAIEQGYRHFSFLRGDDDYKQQWTSSRRMTREARIFRAGLKGLWPRALDKVAGLFRGKR
jgi:CelD/BcsL family acetyltransferase involved in cellulose biosynthesis